jgi:EAL domain-containing protein (putative c-di-GMP-specific phosphodiesterase class I)
MDHDSRAITRMNQLHDHGIRIALDDFGTGYSSLSTINDLKLNTIKIDKSLIKRSDVQELTTMMIHMGHMMRLEIVAEGVETEMEMKELEEAGCDRLQGFLFSKPIPFEEVGPFIQKYYKTRF